MKPASRPKVKRIDPLEPLKMEIAAELGLLEQVQTKGWHSLNAKDAGKIGGLMTQRRRRENLKERNDE
ncbi:small, acid-soluble spore protein, alpha/beta type [Desulfosporosinus sp. PR]|uniref:small, acid-soluble spore protein, alpha/beta type n=1 Tax=Candidatus Desulfosporosinus nitrosoreducens TaxID=3401928 RepID=UPI0027FA9168|nr:small, acid-soluble spore protein, alpha/beta type [Desulfosporosinus sp. PR]MDQ7092572.1 small, acid-soluble spore protein, alpha/beta type [Desulfosporosinus sp. PR]